MTEAIGAIILSPRQVATGDPAGQALENLNTAILGDGTLAYVSSGAGKGQWQLDKSATDAPDGTTIVAPTSGPGRWFLKLGPGAGAGAATLCADIRAFGASTASADNTAAIQAAIDFVEAEGGGAVCVPAGVWTCLSTLIVASDNVVIRGVGAASVLFNDGNDLHVIVVSGASRVSLESLELRGNNTGTGSTNAVSGGHGVFVRDSTDFSCVGVKFDGIGAGEGSSASCIFTFQCARVTVHECFFESGSVAATGADVAVAYGTGKTQTTDCYSRSEMDTFVNIGAVSYEPDGSDVIDHVVVGNIAERAVEGRHGVIFAYGANPGRVSVVGNVFVNFNWNGAYASGAVAPSTAEDSEGATISNNVIVNCGGGNTPLSSGILVTGTAGAAVSANLILKAGIDSNGEARANPTPGIQVLQFTENVSIVGNSISDCTGAGISLVDSASNGTHKNITISGNTIRDPGTYGIQCQPSGADGTFENVQILGNLIEQSVDDHGILVRAANSSTIKGLHIAHNQITNTHEAPSAGAGVQWWGLNSDYSGSVDNNRITGYWRGVSSVSGVPRGAPDFVSFTGNWFVDCVTGANLVGSNQPLVVFDSTFENCGSNLGVGNYAGRSLGVDGSGSKVFEVDTVSAPGAGVWEVGDRARFQTPVAGGSIGAVCTTAPSTWKTYGAIAP